MKRQTLSLDGIWETTESRSPHPPSESFPHRTPVPGLIDQSEPAFAAVAAPLEPKIKDAYSNFDSHRSDLLTDPRRDYFWYRRTFTIDGPVPATALLKIRKAMYGTQVYLNGQDLGQHLPNFTPGYFDTQKALMGNGAENTLLIRIGAARDVSPSSPVNGHDHEKCRYIPGIPDSVELILTGEPHVRNVQIAPEPKDSRVQVRVELTFATPGQSTALSFRVDEASEEGALIAEGTHELSPSGEATRIHHFFIALPDARLWSPESPFLYRLTLETPGDRMETRFGMRSFRFDENDGRAYLNESPYYLLGTNICMYRFYEDDQRGGLPWDREWARRLLTQFKELNWNSFRASLGPLPDFWYDLADEIGFIIQDEFAVWDPSSRVTPRHLIEEYTEWMRERWNHASVLVWDAQNETPPDRGGEATSAAIDAVRQLDLSDRPWDNGWSPPRRATDPIEVHLYLVKEKGLIDHLNDLGSRRPPPWRWHTQKPGPHQNNALICNEYGWMWIDREGRPSLLSKNFRPFENFIWDKDEANREHGPEDYRYAFARTFALLTEYWRAFGKLAGIQHFSALTYSREDGHTSDNLINVAEPRFEPYFWRHAKDAFQQTIVVLDLWNPEAAAGGSLSCPIVVINDDSSPFTGKVVIDIRRHEDQPASDASAELTIEVAPHEQTTQTVELAKLPAEPGSWRIIATLYRDTACIMSSLRNICLH